MRKKSWFLGIYPALMGSKIPTLKVGECEGVR